MNWAATSQHAFRLVAGLVVICILAWALHLSGLTASLAPDAEGLSMVITLIGAIYAVIFAFVIFVIWGQFTEVESASSRECSSLNDLLRFSQYLNPDSNRAIRRAVSEYSQRVTSSEWHSLGEHRRDQSSEKAFSALIHTVLKTQPANPAEEALIERLIDIVRKVGEQRDERIAKSLTRIPPTLLGLVRVMAIALLVLVFFFPFHCWIAGMGCMAVLTIILFLSNLVMTDTDNPFEGIFNVSPRPFTELSL